MFFYICGARGRSGVLGLCPPAGVQGRASVGGLGACPPKLQYYCILPNGKSVFVNASVKITA